MTSPNSPTRDDRLILHGQTIGENGPGTILRDFETLLSFISREGVLVSGKYDLLTRETMTRLNAQLTHPIEMGLKRPMQKSYPYIQGLYLLLRSTGLALVEERASRKRLALDETTLQAWRGLNPTERYFTLLEAWLLRGRAETIIGERVGFLDVPIMRWAEFFRRIPDEGLKVSGDKGQELLIAYSPGLYVIALLDMFGFAVVQHGIPEEGKGWRIATVRRTPFGDAMLRLLSSHLLTEERLMRRWEETEVATFGELQPIVQPFFPEWRQNLSLPEVEFQDGTYLFRVSLGKRVWRRIAMPGRGDFDALSDAILEAFEFDHDHLYKFTYKGRFGIPVDINHPYVEEPPFTTEVQVGGIGLKPGTTLTYLYDFGDNWEFEVLLERISPVDPKMRDTIILETHGKAPEQYPDWDE